jgi:hypothetical protein
MPEIKRGSQCKLLFLVDDELNLGLCNTIMPGEDEEEAYTNKRWDSMIYSLATYIEKDCKWIARNTISRLLG